MEKKYVKRKSYILRAHCGNSTCFEHANHNTTTRFMMHAVTVICLF